MAEWTDERIETLKRLHADGWSMSRIAKALGGVTRNAVIGKAQRLKLPARSNTASARDGKVGRRGRTGMAKPIRPKAPPRSPAPWKPRKIEDIPVPVSVGVSILDLTDRMCKWPHGEGPYLFCGHKAELPLPYCEYHVRLAYQPVERRPKSERFVVKRNFDLPEVVA